MSVVLHNHDRNIDAARTEKAGGCKSDDDRFICLKTDRILLIIDATVGERPQIVYWGEALVTASPAEIERLSIRQNVQGGPTATPSPSLSNELGAGTHSVPGLLIHKDRAGWGGILRVESAPKVNAHAVQIRCSDPYGRFRAIYDFALKPQSHVLAVTTTLENYGDTPLMVEWCAALCMPLTPQLNRVMTFTGRWALEFQTHDVTAFPGGFLRENRSGRTSHDCFPGLIAASANTSETFGAAAGFHLGWSGDHRTRVDWSSDGRAFLQMGELFAPGEIEIASGDSYVTPILYASWSNEGLNGLSQQFHTHLSSVVMDGRAAKKPRPVHFNSWEAVYFDHSEDALIALAERSASLGAERFVLDDGWFGARRSDEAGLGDWWVSQDVYPQGLARLADTVRTLGMEFGLWFEPEMVNLDSQLYRRHPDWALQDDGATPVPFRHQVPLDLRRDDVSNYLFDNINAIVGELQVGYIKWDMNREVRHPGPGGRGAIHQQTLALYALMQRLRDRHPNLEIESCSSGGARADFGILRHTDRVWLSDSNDALDRQRIQYGASYFFPPHVLGSHVGPHRCHITGRVLSMEFRAATAFFGHMGLELDLMQETEADLGVLKNAIALHKEHRDLIHQGDFVRLETPSCQNAIGVIAKDRSQALFSVATAESLIHTLPPHLRFVGLDNKKYYRVRLIWPSNGVISHAESIIECADLVGEGTVFSGESLTAYGLQQPRTHPASCLIFHLTEE